MNDWLAVAVCGATGGAAGYTVSALRPTGRRRGEHRSLWQRAVPRGPREATDVPVTGLDPNIDDAPTEHIPVPGGGVRIPEGEQ
ncbi:hypothetical protein DMA15_03700 [Streptomyces sp. WAC 01529]|uniref:hypothetical protein n=1 Tax=Streptomyces sp. WAC 01529 TaxID=2203205 RepID=UPI000F6E2599|nr:hypothetical protein [Streptomyces sp. WAC 01529]AZM51798.1 hypothetical protein DMA15_03700 [Streptomyces sp. WAC 01529]